MPGQGWCLCATFFYINPLYQTSNTFLVRLWLKFERLYKPTKVFYLLRGVWTIYLVVQPILSPLSCSCICICISNCIFLSYIFPASLFVPLLAFVFVFVLWSDFSRLASLPHLCICNVLAFVFLFVFAFVFVFWVDCFPDLSPSPTSSPPLPRVDYSWDDAFTGQNPVGRWKIKIKPSRKVINFFYKTLWEGANLHFICNKDVKSSSQGS